jgi:tetratricopeptide (TPR) repeat protein
LKENLFRVQGYAYLGLKKYSMAEQYLKLSLEENATSPEQQYVKYELGKLFFKNGDFDLGLPYLEEIKEFFKSKNTEYYLSILFFLGFTYYYLENISKAQNCFNEIVQSNPNDQRHASALFGFAYIEFNKKNYLNVISLCEQVIAKDNNFFDKESIGFLTAASYFYLGRKDLFNAYFDQMIKSYPTGRYRKELEELKRKL